MQCQIQEGRGARGLNQASPDINSNKDMKRQGLGLQAKSGADALGSGD